MHINDDSNIIIRLATPSDAKHCAPLIYSSAQSKFDYGLGSMGHDPILAIESAFAAYLSPFHRVVEKEGRIVGVGAFYTIKEANKPALQALRWAIDYYGILKLPKLAYRMNQLTQQQRPLDRNTLYVSNIAVVSQEQGQGIGTMIVESFGTEADKRGMAYALDVSIDNTKAIRLYEKLGFKYQWQKPFTGSASANIEVSCRYIRVK